MCQNIKRIYPDSKLIFVCDKPTEEAAKYQKDVDEVIVYDKNGKHKGCILGPIRFAVKFPYKKIFAAFITYKNGRSLTVTRLLRPKYTFSVKKKCFDTHKQKQHNQMLSLLTDKNIINYPICFEIPENIKGTTKVKFNLPDKFITLCTISKNPPKDMPLKTASELINKINKEKNYKVVFIGTGEKTKQYAEELKKKADFINLTNKTSLLELADILSNSKGLISVDTGVMHLGCALRVPVVAVFYEQHTIPVWAPPEELYNAFVVSSNQTSENILSSFKNLIIKNDDK